jgi:hypothetical protein
MNEIIQNAWLITRVLLTVVYSLLLLAFLVGTPTVLGSAPGRAKLWTVPVAAGGILLGAAFPLFTRWLGFP